MEFCSPYVLQLWMTFSFFFLAMWVGGIPSANVCDLAKTFVGLLGRWQD